MFVCAIGKGGRGHDRAERGGEGQFLNRMQHKCSCLVRPHPKTLSAALEGKYGVNAAQAGQARGIGSMFWLACSPNHARKDRKAAWVARSEGQTR